MIVKGWALFIIYDRQRLGHSKQMSLGLATTSTPSTGLLVLLLKETIVLNCLFVLLTLENVSTCINYDEEAMANTRSYPQGGEQSCKPDQGECWESQQSGFDPRGQPVLINGVQVVQLTTRLNKVKVEQEMASTKKSSIDLDSDDFLSGSSSVKTEIASLSSQVSDLLWIINVICNPNFWEDTVDIMFFRCSLWRPPSSNCQQT